MVRGTTVKATAMLKHPSKTNILYTPIPSIQGVMANTSAVEMMFRTKTTPVRASPRICEAPYQRSHFPADPEPSTVLGTHKLITILAVRQSNITTAANSCTDEARAYGVDGPWHALVESACLQWRTWTGIGFTLEIVKPYICRSNYQQAGPLKARNEAWDLCLGRITFSDVRLTNNPSGMHSPGIKNKYNRCKNVSNLYRCR
jgi:hypothetical protein